MRKNLILPYYLRYLYQYQLDTWGGGRGWGGGVGWGGGGWGGRADWDIMPIYSNLFAGTLIILYNM